MFLKKFKIFFAHKKLKKPPQKVAYLWQLRLFFSAAPTAQNSPELHFRFISSFIQPSLVGSLIFCYYFSDPPSGYEKRILWTAPKLLQQFSRSILYGD